MEVQVDPLADTDIRSDIRLMEYILLNLDFNYEEKVPSAKMLTFRMPDM